MVTIFSDDHKRSRQTLQDLADKIEIKLKDTNFYTRWPCTVCGGHTEKVGILAEGKDTINGGGDIRVCETCLKAGDIDARLEAHAARQIAYAAELRALIGHLKVPTYEEWQAAERNHDIQSMEDHGEINAETAARLRNDPTLPLDSLGMFGNSVSGAEPLPF